MKSVRFNRENAPTKPRYLKGHLYININDVVIICSTDDHHVLNGTILNSRDSDTIGDHERISTLVCVYDEFHGTVILDN